MGPERVEPSILEGLHRDFVVDDRHPELRALHAQGICRGSIKVLEPMAAQQGPHDASSRPISPPPTTPSKSRSAVPSVRPLAQEDSQVAAIDESVAGEIGGALIDGAGFFRVVGLLPVSQHLQ